jgi:hypothetical protein
LEDGAKLLGILAWTSFHLTAALQIIGAAIRDPSVWTDLPRPEHPRSITPTSI